VEKSNCGWVGVLIGMVQDKKPGTSGGINGCFYTRCLSPPERCTSLDLPCDPSVGGSVSKGGVSLARLGDTR
jgi:hypothetical protein